MPVPTVTGGAGGGSGFTRAKDFSSGGASPCPLRQETPCGVLRCGAAHTEHAVPVSGSASNACGPEGGGGLVAVVVPGDLEVARWGFLFSHSTHMNTSGSAHPPPSAKCWQRFEPGIFA